METERTGNDDTTPENLGTKASDNFGMKAKGYGKFFTTEETKDVQLSFRELNKLADTFKLLLEVNPKNESLRACYNRLMHGIDKTEKIIYEVPPADLSQVSQRSY